MGADELITAFLVPAAPWTRRSLFLKVRDRESYEFALASAAVALDLVKGTVREARIALGGVATLPWRAHEAEALLRDKPLDEQSLAGRGRCSVRARGGYGDNNFKVELGKRTLKRALPKKRHGIGGLTLAGQNAAAPAPLDNMGAPAPRIDARLKVIGQARFPGGHAVANPAYAFLVTSVIAKGHIERIELDDARQVRGVLDILTYRETSGFTTDEFGIGSSTSIQTLGPEFCTTVRSSR